MVSLTTTQNVTVTNLGEWSAGGEGHHVTSAGLHLAVIAVLSLVVVAGFLFAIFGLVVKAEALGRAAGPPPSTVLTEGLLFDERGSWLHENITPMTKEKK